MKIIKAILIVIVLLMLGFWIFTKSNLKVIMAEAREDGYRTYPQDCYLNVQGKEYLIENVYKYEHKILSEFWFLGSEGFAVQKLSFFKNNYSHEQMPYRLLTYSTNKSYVTFNSKKYKIDAHRGDTIISKIDNQKIILFIDK
ncbi:hypothetical protein LZQ00_03105 [Sphingobacterium sp. SRCM116780]|uniref:hypothetical protein n=1 Tax=Sphingobacterium sp. SRCM116780 TaxID=2907623 RepID=UPI001F3D6141|nr:hypothetical protein [Sphingobacterium sp. SRCM116780]UIR56813.1 hypothetical protein LZQ00_03105 [Sphingobacterium sp. SRCM116780]